MRDLAGQGLTMIVVTYEIGFARATADRVVFVDEGIVVEQGPPDEMLVNPKHARTQAFLGRICSGQDLTAKCSTLCRSQPPCRRFQR